MPIKRGNKASTNNQLYFIINFSVLNRININKTAWLLQSEINGCPDKKFDASTSLKTKKLKYLQSIEKKSAIF